MPILELKEVTKAYNDFKVIDGFNFSVDQGELRCLIGPNGAGKTTSIDLITGRQKLSSGEVYFDGKRITKLMEREICIHGIGRKFQVPAVFKDLTVRENFEVALTDKRGPFQNMNPFQKNRGRKHFNDIIELADLGDRLDIPAGFLSHGETQWLEIGMVLMQKPRLLLMDEPTAGMTEQETEKTSKIFKELKGEHTLVVVEHDMKFVRSIADRISVMHQGKMLAEGTVTEIEQHEKVKEVYLGTEGIH
ncbi:MAG: urea ABC transporter ATP-binding protein UrtD [Gammaproteobacteria bacterium]|nr:urea ABC transporter ATP-binding protein UrtD [Gammaproteobacteria bacterium]